MPIPYTPDTNYTGRYFTEGEGQFEVVGWEEKITATGNIMGLLKIRIWDSKGRNGLQNDFLFSNSEMTATRIKTFLMAIDRVEDNEIGPFDGRMYIGKTGKLKMGYKPNKREPEQGDLLWFIYLPAPKKEEAPVESAPFVDSAIPF